MIFPSRCDRADLAGDAVPAAEDLGVDTGWSRGPSDHKYRPIMTPPSSRPLAPASVEQYRSHRRPELGVGSAIVDQ